MPRNRNHTDLRFGAFLVNGIGDMNYFVYALKLCVIFL